MATLTELYEEIDAKTATVLIRVGGVTLTEFISADWSFAFQQVPTATIRVSNPPPATAVFNAAVTIDAGFNGVTTRVFTGTVLNVNPDETGCTIECQGKSKVLENTFHPVILPIDPLFPIDGTDDAEKLILDLLVAAGVTSHSIDLPHWHPGTQELSVDPDKEPHPILEFQTYGEAIIKIAEVDGGRWYELPTGTIRINVSEPLPSLTAWRNYFSMRLTGLIESYPVGIVAPARPRLRRISGSQQARDVKNACSVKGCTYEHTNDDLTISAIDVEGDATAPSPWVRNPDGTQAYSYELFSNELIDTPAKAGEVAGRIVALKNRLVMQVDAEIDGDPQVVLGVTVRIEDPDYSRLSGRWFVESYSSRIDSSGFSTSLTLLGGSEAGGTVNISPFALFTYVVEYEVIGAQRWAIVTFDAGGSIDPDGTIDHYVWSDNQATTPEIAGLTTEVVTVRIDPAMVPPWNVTLTVEDNAGAFDDITLTIYIEPGEAAVTIPSLYVAMDNHFSASPDGGLNWDSQDVPVGDSVISIGAKSYDGLVSGIAVFGTNLGALYRTTDFCVTAPTLVQAACGFPIMDVKFSITQVGVVWALSRNGLLYRSLDDGATWALYDDLAAKFGLAGIYCKSVATPIPNGVWVFGGTGTGYPLVVWDAFYDHNWVGVNIGGELAVDLNASGHPVDLYVAGAGSSAVGQGAILLNSATHPTSVYYTADIFGDGSAWTRCTGLPAKTRGRWLAVDYSPYQFVFAYDDIAVYLGDVNPATNIMAATPAAATLDVGDAPNYGVWLGGYVIGIGSCYIVCAEGIADGTLYKSWDRFATIGKLWPAAGGTPAVPPVGANAEMMAIGAPELAAAAEARILVAGLCTALKRMAAWREGLDDFTKKLFATELGNCDCLVPLALTSSLWFILGFDNNNIFTDSDNKIVRTQDSGATWVAFTQPKAGSDYWQDFQLDAGGRLWGLTLDTTANAGLGRAKVWYSIDEGDTWTGPVLTIDGSGLDICYVHKLITHPTNQNIIVAFGYKRFANPRVVTWYTTDRGANWNEGYNATTADLRRAHSYRPIMLSNGRILCLATEYSSGVGDDAWILKSDDYGETWSVAYTFPLDAPKLIFGLARNSLGSKVFVMQIDTSATPDTSFVYMSTDFGNSWQAFDTPIPLPDATYVYRGGLAYDEIEDALYVFGEGDLIVNTNLLMKMTPVALDGSWNDVSDTLVPIGAETKYTIAVAEAGQYIVVIPR